jgi:hypothetical protein
VGTVIEVGVDGRAHRRAGDEGKALHLAPVRQAAYQEVTVDHQRRSGQQMARLVQQGALPGTPDIDAIDNTALGSSITVDVDERAGGEISQVIVEDAIPAVTLHQIDHPMGEVVGPGLAVPARTPTGQVQ